MENVVTLSVQSVNLYLLEGSAGWLLIDPGWAGSLPAFQSELRRYKIALPEIRYVLFTHHHPDHAGLAQEIKNACKARLIIHEIQIPFLEDLEAFFRLKKQPFVPVQIGPEDVVLRAGQVDALRGLGIPAVVVETPGHSEDSISVLSDGGLAFVGDLTPPGFATEEHAEAVEDSWIKLVTMGAKTIYPAHGPVYGVERLR